MMLQSYKMSFKPYYKWITFNTEVKTTKQEAQNIQVLNLIINGLPSIQKSNSLNNKSWLRFKPYYKWITFNTEKLQKEMIR